MSAKDLSLAEEQRVRGTVSESEAALLKEKLKQQQEAAALMEKRIYVALTKETPRLNNGGFPQISNAFYKKLGIQEEKQTGVIHIQALDNLQTMSTAIHVGVLKILQKSLNPVISAEDGTALQNVLLLQTLLAPSVSCSIAPAKLKAMISNIEKNESQCGLSGKPLKILIALSQLNSKLQANHSSPMSAEERHQALEAAVKSDALSEQGINKEEALAALKGYDSRLTQLSEKAADKPELSSEPRAAGLVPDDDDNGPESGASPSSTFG